MAITAIGQQLSLTDNQQSSRVSFTLSDREKLLSAPPATASNRDSETTTFTLSLDGVMLPSSVATALQDGHYLVSNLRLSDHPQTLTVTLNRPDDFMADNQASIVLPAQSRIRVAVQTGLPEWITRFVRSNPTLDESTSEVDVSLCLDESSRCPEAKAVVYLLTEASGNDNTARYYSALPAAYQTLAAFWRDNHWQDQAGNEAMPALMVIESDHAAVHLPLPRLSHLIKRQNPDPLMLLSQAISWLASPPSTPPYVAVNEPLPLWRGEPPPCR